MRPAPARCRSGARPRRGFVFLLVLMLIAVAGITIGAALQRSALHSAVAQRQLEGYRQHHEMLGVRDYVEWWLSKRENDARQLAGYALVKQAVHRLVLDNNVVVLISVQDGQGTVLRSLENVSSIDQRRWLVEVLARLPANRPDLTRRSGSHLISLHAAPDEVLDAMAAYDTKTLRGLHEARSRRVANPTEFQTTLQRHNVEDMVARVLSQQMAFEPTLWRMNVEVIHPERVNRYTLLAEKKANLTHLHEWRPVSDAEAERLFGFELADPTGAVKPF